ncbi:MAG: hypothetical protein NC118_14020 [Eubacterium sp.]|nr:hypothetical protein [Eubacterium sp.]
MKNKKKNRYNPRGYWKEHHKFDSNEEFLIYQYLCGNIKKKEEKKLSKEKKFQKYKAWRQHVEKFVSQFNNDNDTLLEFYHFIKLEARHCNNEMGLNTHFAMPFVVAVVSGGIIPWLLNSGFSQKEQVIQGTVLEQVLMYIILLICIYIIAGSIALFLIHFLLEYINSKNEAAFWGDYLEIIEEKVQEKERKN